MNTSDEQLILRTLYLPKSLDNALINASYTNDQSKAEIIRKCIRYALENGVISGSQSVSKKVAAA